MENQEIEEVLQDDVLKTSEEIGEDQTSDETQVEVPEKFKGKSPAEITKAYEELEKRLGEQSNELGELRKLAREVLVKDLNTKPKVEEEQVKISEDDLRDNPLDAITKIIDSKLSKIEKKLSAVDINSARKDFETKHPDVRQIGQSKEFNDWVASSPYRIQLYAKADANDFLAADELLSSYKEYSKSKTEFTEDLETNMKEDTKKVMKKMKGEGSSSGASTKKVYRSADLIRLKQTDPDRYESLQEEIMTAYREGRVK